ncbi:MAG: sulfatase [Opitutaceae bacterium]|nr:sulfatase [Opitutaceae bacterium]
MKHALKLLALGLLILAALPAADRRPNVLFIAVDDLRPELGAYGARHIKSPHIDRLAATGVRFDRAYVQYAICGPSRASTLTGLRPGTLKIEHIDTFFRDTVPDVVTLPQLFKQHGYTTAYAGKIFHGAQTDDANSWSRRIPPAGGPGDGGYQLPESREIVRKRREAAIAKYGKEANLGGVTSGPAWEAADAPDNAYLDGRNTDAAIGALRELKGKPFFLGVGFLKPHLPFVAPKKYFDLYDPATLPLAATLEPPKDAPSIARHSSFELRTRTGVPTAGPIDAATSRQLLHAYAACVSFVDAQVGRILAELDALGLSENTIVVFWGDHGWHLGDHGIWGKATNYEIGTRIPLIIRAPGMAGNGRPAAGIVESLDIYPTLCALAGLKAPAALEGASLVPMLRDPAVVGKNIAFSEFPAPALREWAAKPLSPAMRQTFFGPLIETVEAQLAREHGARYDRKFFEDHVKGYSVRTEPYRCTVWVDRRAPESEPLAIELYDHRADPRETRNIAAQPEQREVLAELQALLRRS